MRKVPTQKEQERAWATLLRTFSNAHPARRDDARRAVINFARAQAEARIDDPEDARFWQSQAIAFSESA